ncbi:hypothetical protein MAR_004705, partial [Mya arenaria]
MSLSRLVFIADKERTVNTAFSKFSSLLVGNAGARDDRIAALEAKVDQPKTWRENLGQRLQSADVKDGQTYGGGYVDARVATGDCRVGSYTWVVELNPSSM